MRFCILSYLISSCTSTKPSFPLLHSYHGRTPRGDRRSGSCRAVLICFGLLCMLCFENGGTFPNYRHVEAGLLDLTGLIKIRRYHSMHVPHLHQILSFSSQYLGFLKDCCIIGQSRSVYNYISTTFLNVCAALFRTRSSTKRSLRGCNLNSEVTVICPED